MNRHECLSNAALPKPKRSARGADYVAWAITRPRRNYFFLDFFFAAAILEGFLGASAEPPPVSTS